jgi:hypothetical protein
MLEEDTNAMTTKRESQTIYTKPHSVLKSRLESQVVMDVLPWPSGYGFTGGDTWRQNVLSQSERERLDNLVGLAVLDQNVCEQLVMKRDPALLNAFGLSSQTCDWLTGVEATTLQGFAQAIVSASEPPGLDPAGTTKAA